MLSQPVVKLTPSSSDLAKRLENGEELLSWNLGLKFV